MDPYSALVAAVQSIYLRKSEGLRFKTERLLVSQGNCQHHGGHAVEVNA